MNLMNFKNYNLKYFTEITTPQQAKERYRKLAKKMHPDVGGSPIEFQAMQKEYQTCISNFKEDFNKKEVINNSTNNELLSELGKLALELIDKQVPQTILKKRIPKSKTVLEKKLYSGIINFLDGL